MEFTRENIKSDMLKRVVMSCNLLGIKNNIYL